MKSKFVIPDDLATDILRAITLDADDDPDWEEVNDPTSREMDFLAEHLDRRAESSGVEVELSSEGARWIVKRLEEREFADSVIQRVKELFSMS